MPEKPEETTPANAGGRPLGEPEDGTPAVLRVIKIETPGASASGVFNLGEPSTAGGQDTVPPRSEIIEMEAQLPGSYPP